MNSPENFSPARLDPCKYQDMHWCSDCGGPRIVISVFEIESGRFALCLGCGGEKFLPFTRITTEAA